MWRPAVLALALAGGSAVAGPAVQSWLTTSDQTRLLAPQPVSRFAPGKPLALSIDVDSSRRYQSMIGFGAALTDASAWLIRHKLDDTQRQALLSELFGRADGGAGFGLARLVVGASDFSLKHYSYDDRPAGETDAALAHFSIDEARGHVLPVVQQALAINPALYLIASPWSAPGWMKTGGSLIKGRLRPDRFDAFSRYLLRSVDAFAAEGVSIAALTLQNEPHFEPEDYPGMRLEPADRSKLIAQHLGPMLASRGGQPQLIEWDHNWDVPESPLSVLADPQANRFIAGVGWHCYGGQVQAQSRVHEAYPDKDVWLTECSGGAWAPDWAKSLPWMVNQLVIGSTRHWARGVLLWNLALDEQHGPHLGGCKDCRGVVTIDSKNGAVTRNLEYYALAHASRFVRAGARRIASSEAVDGLQNVAFRHEDDGSVVLIACNDAAEAKTFSVRQGVQILAYTLPRESVATLVWRP
ncbi:MAG: glycosyl hydrolase [Burkholderiaceae bacterium]|nr:glycosyl hydrolase [Burkholderiaceae bacterium]